MAAVIELQQITKAFGATKALDGVSLAVPAGSVCALLGANGAGKTTAIKILLGLLAPDSGEAKVLGLDSQKYGIEARRQIGYVSDKPALYDWMTVDEIGWFASAFYTPGYMAGYQKLVRRFELPTSQTLKNLSKGMRSKVALALAMAHEPELLILDEPTSGLDPLVRREFLESMVDIAAQGRTVFISSHQVSEVERVADMVAILIHGQLVAFERTEELRARTREVVVTIRDANQPEPNMPGTILATQDLGPQLVYMVRDLDEGVLQNQCPYPLEVHEPHLEDILLALLREERRQSVGRTSTTAVR